ncbi:hypothetical protein L6164_020471 [Bauhinia variegata]|uniref:Uncharacterized protein n=1 Tax=Bauhinia variegata TaxID=167791 RepID=A0ACB9MX84_BAUVA|nr:hypothetical protein L6164_020471 [Bauhinia variegata]
MDEGRVPSNTSIPLVSRLDHLEFLMKYVERKQRGGSNACAERRSMPLNSAVKDDYFKGSLLDRVASLEHRLFQLCLEMDSSGNSHPLSSASTQTSGESSSSHGSKGETCYSLPTFTVLPNLAEKAKSQSQVSLTLGMQEKSKILQNQVADPSCPQEEVEMRRDKRSNEKKCKSKKKRRPPTWPHMKLLGCS